MSTAIMQIQGLSLDEHSVLAHQEVMNPSPVAQTPKSRARHGRGKHGGSIGRARASSNANEREVQISKALTWILKRAGGEKAAADGAEIEVNEDGWADCEEVVRVVNHRASFARSSILPSQS